MSAIRLPLIGGFVGGCLSSAVLLAAFWPGDPASVPAPKQRSSNSELVTASLVPTSARPPRKVKDDAARPPSSAAQDESSSAEAEPPTPPGSAVSDILTDLETAYRRRLAKAVPEEAPAAVAHQPSAQVVSALAHAEPAREVATQAVIQATTVVPPVTPATLVPAAPARAPAAIVAPPTAPAEVAAAASEVAAVPQVAAAPAPQVGQHPPAVHIGDINNTYVTNVTNVRHGDVYLMQQQVAMLQYMQLLGLSSLAGRTGLSGMGVPAAATPMARGMSPQTPQFRQFPSTLTNPDNPWGFTFSPPNLVH
jgi:hypothetical protein